MERNLTCKIVMEIDEGGEKFAKFTAEYSRMDIADVVEVEEIVIGGLLSSAKKSVASQK